MPPFLLTDGRGNQVTNRDMLGRRYGLLFFRADCEYCIGELRHLDEVVPGYESRFDLLLVSLSDAEMTEHIKSKSNLSLEYYTASPDSISRLKLRGVPLLLLIDEHEKISYLQTGLRSKDFQRIVFHRFVSGESLTDEALRSAYKPGTGSR